MLQVLSASQCTYMVTKRLQSFVGDFGIRHRASLDCQHVHVRISSCKKKKVCLDGNFTNLSAFCLWDNVAHKAGMQIFKYFSVT